ncbi:MAG: carboxylesterase family protein [Intrasporangium sp.]|uniref:carboxylesterase/lipase family protein n=1 Tax=Intrasporangium sp. TaxID=1925024 RepID=UPI002648C81E|nr:carboxylesterase family protein [Intrasporangium sp.]MDN5796332.1 carboxylesterase family protein [Intrasporangium sp.]
MEVKTSAGLVRGFWRGRSAAFLGIPFAEPPVGPLRFAAPVPHRSWDGVRDATSYGATAQRGGDGGVSLIPEPSYPGESTLNVNVFTPAPAGPPDLPVLVYIHGGGFVSGSPSSPWYDGAAFNRDGVVTVSVSYRLGLEGFGWIEGATPNRAVLDWLLALEWVRDNIAAFGGDPARVTISGQSAGGGAVLTLLGMPRAQGLFARAHSMSGVCADIPLARAEATGRAIAEQAGVQPTVAGLSSLTEEQVRHAQDAASSAATKGGPLAMLKGMLEDGLPFGPVVDGELITQPTPDAFAAGIGTDKPLLLGTTEDEFTFIFTQAHSKLRFIPTGVLLARIGVPASVRHAWLAANPGPRAAGTAAAIGRYVTDRVFRAPTLRLAQVRAEHTRAPTWLTTFTWRSRTRGLALHCIDVPFVFDNLDAERVADLAGEDPPQKLARELHSDVVGFVQNGSVDWSAFDAETATTKRYDLPPSIVEHGYQPVRALL